MLLTFFHPLLVERLDRAHVQNNEPDMRKQQRQSEDGEKPRSGRAVSTEPTSTEAGSIRRTER